MERVAHTRSNLDLPKLDQLGRHLLYVSPQRRKLQVLLPFISMLAYMAAVEAGYYLLLLPLIVAHFTVSMATTHDVVHGSLGLSRRQGDFMLFMLSVILAHSAHAHRRTHLWHHSHCLEADDLEGGPASGSLSSALLIGPVYVIRLWFWAYAHSTNPRERRWMLAEAALSFAALAATIAASPWSMAPLIYLISAWIGTWFYPLFTAWLPHYLGEARTLRGRVIPAALMNLTYHLEHHLYPQVPGVNLAQLAKQLDPYFNQRGMNFPQVY